MSYRHLLAVAVTALTVIAAVGCGNQRAILYKGVGTGDRRLVITDEAARQAARHGYAMWKKELANRAAAAPHQRFMNLSPTTMRSRLLRLASRYDFTIRELSFERPRQLAPRIVVSTRHYVALAHEVSAIEERVDPRIGSGDPGTFAYEGIYFEARDERGVPFIVTWNALRGKNVVGSQFARSEDLFPFNHG